MYIKLAGSLLVLAVSVIVGRLKAKELQVRVLRLEEFKRMLLLLQGELRFHRSTLSEAFENVAKRVEDPFSAFLMETSRRMEEKDAGGFECIWKETSKKLLLQDGFQKEDERLFDLLQGSLGYLDFAMQTETLNLAMLQSEEVIQDAKEQKELKGKLYQTMGGTVGALLALLIL